MRLIRLLAARGLLWLARAADEGLDMLDIHAMRSRIARLCVKIASAFADLAELIAPWTGQDYVPPTHDNRPPTSRELALVLARVKLGRWRRALRRIAP